MGYQVNVSTHTHILHTVYYSQPTSSICESRNSYKIVKY